MMSESPFQELVAIMQRLRGPNGCPWDLKQNHQTLIPYLIEEAYELIEAIEANDSLAMREELGDLMLQIVFHAQLASERGDFNADDVCRAINDKMVRRHPHVFGQQAGLESAEEVLQQWEVLKSQEKEGPRSVLEGVSSGLPALPQAALLQQRVRRQGFAYPDVESAWSKFEEELCEFRSSPSPEEFGDMLFALVSVAHFHGIDPEAALRSTNRKFRQRYQRLEERFSGSLPQQSSETLHAAWNELKARSQP